MKGFKTYIVAVATVGLAALDGVDWSQVLSAEHSGEKLAVIGAGIALGRAIVSLFRVMGKPVV